MTSSMLAGERRWASARRGGMTVLGKVAVPKPINLPSQKLENHGLDPNVEIVPKGSLSWGSRPSSSTSNPWGSSAVSPNADGTNVSPHHPSGRPSSGGGRSRPSTAGSDRHEPSATTWGPNSRPSSASGVLTSNQSSLTSSRPLSAETRPGSSHLSRFAEPTFDNSMAWGPNGTADKMASVCIQSIPSKANDFSLSSGDFPTLGSEKDNTAKSSEAHDHGSHVRPGSGSGRTAHSMDRNEMIHTDHKSGTVDTWTRDSSPHFEDGARPGIGKWQGDPQQYINPNVPPQHFDAWRGPPMNAPPAGIWYRGPPPAGPPYPPVPHGGYPMEPFPYYHPQIPPNMANPQSGPPPGPGPRGHHPRNGDFYRPQMPDAFMRPGMPIRPGFYPGPVPYDGYYGPPMGYNPNDRDIPFMGMPPGPHGPHGPPVYNKGPPQNPSELSDAHFRGSGRGSGGNMSVSEHLDSTPPEESRRPYKVLRKPDHERLADIDDDNWEQNLDKSDQPRPTFQKNEWGVDTRRNEDMHSRRNLGNQGHPSDSVMVHSHEGPHKSKPFSETLGNKFPEVHQDVPANSKDPSLIQKIEGLNAKIRASDGSGVVREEQKNRLLINPNHKENSTTIAFGTISDIGDLNNSKSTTASASLVSRLTHHELRSLPDHHSKGRLNNQDTDGWRKKHSALGSDVAAENLETKNTVDPLTSMADPADGQAQRSRMRELAKQRAVQLQKEEEERIREQKAKALAKLEELNRRTLAAADGTTQSAEKTVNTIHEQEDVDGFQKPSEPASDDNKPGESAIQISENSQQGLVDQPLVLKQNVSNATDAEIKAAQLGNDGNLPKQKGASNKQKLGVQMVESSVDKSTLNAVIKNSGTNMTVSDEGVPSQQPNQSNMSNMSFESTQQRKRNNKSGKNKHKLDDVSASKEGDIAKPESPQFDSKSNDVSVTDGKDAMQSNLEQTSCLPSNQFKPQHPKRMPRNPQASRTADRFHVGDVAVWAPVRAQNKEERVDECSQGTQQDDVALPTKTINSGQTNLKNRRAEMERYVPKPVAKELAQQGTGNQSASTSSPEKTALEDMTDRENLGSQPAIPVYESVGSSVEYKVGDTKQNKQVKSHGAWKQRGPTDLNRDQGFQQDSKKTYQKSTSHQHEHPTPVPTYLNRDQGFQLDTKRSYQKSMSQHEPSNPVPAQQDSKKSYQKSMNHHEPVNPVPTETHEWDPSDGWFMPDEVPPVTSVVKDEGGAAGKGKKPAYKGQRNTVKNHNVDHRDISGAEVEIDQPERPVSSKENHFSQWQPKPQSHKGDWSGGGQNANSAVKPEEPIADKNVRRAPHERKQASLRGRNDSSNQGFGNMEDEGSGFRKYGGQNNRPGGQDNRRQHNQQNANVNRERQRQNFRYEYQPVGSNNNNSNKSSNHDATAAADGSGNPGPRYKERGSGQSGHGGGASGGNFYGRQ